MLNSTIDWSKAHLKKISVCIDGHATSISLERFYLEILQETAKKNNLSFSALVTQVDETRPPNVNLSAALRVYAFLLAQTPKA